MGDHVSYVRVLNLSAGVFLGRGVSLGSPLSVCVSVWSKQSVILKGDTRSSVRPLVVRTLMMKCQVHARESVYCVSESWSLSVASLFVCMSVCAHGCVCMIVCVV